MFTLWPFLLPGLFRAFSGLFLASSGLFLVSSWPLPGLFRASSWPLLASMAFFLILKISKIQWPPETSFSVHKALRFEQFFAKVWIPGLFWPFPGLFQASSGLFLASSWPLLASSWPLLASSWPLPASSWPLLAPFGTFPGFSKVSKIQGPPETSFSIHKILCFEQFFAKVWIPGFSGPLLASSWPLLAFSWPLPGLFWPLPGLFWPLPGLFWPLLGLFLDSLQNSGAPRDVIFCS